MAPALINSLLMSWALQKIKHRSLGCIPTGGQSKVTQIPLMTAPTQAALARLCAAKGCSTFGFATQKIPAQTPGAQELKIAGRLHGWKEEFNRV